jgi:hypothetical protein
MEALSPVFAALGVIEFDALNDLAYWLDRHVGPMTTSEWPARAGDRAVRATGRPVGGEG